LACLAFAHSSGGVVPGLHRPLAERTAIAGAGRRGSNRPVPATRHPRARIRSTPGVGARPIGQRRTGLARRREPLGRDRASRRTALSAHADDPENGGHDMIRIFLAGGALLATSALASPPPPGSAQADMMAP